MGAAEAPARHAPTRSAPNCFFRPPQHVFRPATAPHLPVTTALCCVLNLQICVSEHPTCPPQKNLRNSLPAHTYVRPARAPPLLITTVHRLLLNRLLGFCMSPTCPASQRAQLPPSPALSVVQPGPGSGMGPPSGPVPQPGHHPCLRQRLQAERCCPSRQSCAAAGK